jgi:hypothetical protein
MEVNTSRNYHNIYTWLTFAGVYKDDNRAQNRKVKTIENEVLGS